MTKQEAIEILEEVKDLDDTMYAYNPVYMNALDMAISIKEIIRNHMNDGWIPVEDERLWDILFEEACVEGEQAKRIYNRLKETFGGERSGKIDKISLQNAVETPFWMMVWATEPERLIDVRMSYSDLKIICDLIDSERNRRAGEQNE